MLPKNPFIISGQIPDQYFCDRVSESNRLIREISGQASNILLMASRRIGKTGLIDYCFRRPEIASRFYTFYIDILHTSSFQEFVCELGKEIYTRITPQGRKLLQSLTTIIRSINPKFSIDPISGIPDFSLEIGSITNPEYTLDEICSWLEKADRPCIVAIDEFQSIGNYPEKNIEAILRSKIQHMNNCHFIFCGSQPHLLSQMFSNYKRPFYMSTTNISLKAIEKGNYRDFAQHWFKESGKVIESEVFDSVYDLFDGNTFCVQRMLHDAFEKTDKGENCSKEICNIALKEILESNSISYRESLSRIGTKPKALLQAIALDGTARQITSGTFIKAHNLPSASSVQASMKILLKYELISKESYEYCVSDKFFSLWLKREAGRHLTLETENPKQL